MGAMSKAPRRVFLSYNKANVAVARRLGAHLFLAGADVWFDEWKIRAGESIPGRLNEGLESFDIFVVLWSKDAARSRWVRDELNSALMRTGEEDGPRLILCRLDVAKLPPLLAHRKFVDFSDSSEGTNTVLAEVLGDPSRSARLRAIQDVLMEMNLDWHPTVGALICCPGCGREGTLESWHGESRHGLYAGMRCTECQWEDGGEV